jgi:hypothetical protein
MNRRNALIGAAVVVALALLGWFTARQSDGGATGSMNGMPGMTTDVASTANQDMPGMSMGSHSTDGMRPLVTGANGTRASAAGLTLRPKPAMFEPGRTTRWQLRVVDRTGKAVTMFDRDQTKLMHLIVVRNDLSDYQHLHPALSKGGAFTIGLRLHRAGSYRAIADFTTSRRRYALGVPIHVAGASTQTPLPPESMNTSTDGYAVMSMHLEPTAGKETRLQFTISRGGRPATALLPYLGAYGHLVALRSADIAYSHVHPTSENRSKGLLSFSAEFPARGAYRLFLQFRTASGVHTAPFTVNVTH